MKYEVSLYSHPLNKCDTDIKNLKAFSFPSHFTSSFSLKKKCVVGVLITSKINTFSILLTYAVSCIWSHLIFHCACWVLFMHKL